MGPPDTEDAETSDIDSINTHNTTNAFNQTFSVPEADQGDGDAVTHDVLNDNVV